MASEVFKVYQSEFKHPVYISVGYLIHIFSTKIIGIGIDEGRDGSFGIITIKKEGKVAMLEQEVNENAEKLNLEGKWYLNFDLLSIIQLEIVLKSGETEKWFEEIYSAMIR